MDLSELVRLGSQYACNGAAGQHRPRRAPLAAGSNFRRQQFPRSEQYIFATSALKT